MIVQLYICVLSNQKYMDPQTWPQEAHRSVLHKIWPATWLQRGLKLYKMNIFLRLALVLCWSYNMLYMKWALALDFYARRFLQCFQLACAAVPRCTVSVKISMKAPPVQPPPPPVFCRPHLAARREAPIITASEGKKCTTPHSVVFCTIAQFVLTKRHNWYLGIPVEYG